MALIVQKYGGTSVGSTERIATVAEKVMATRSQGHDVVVVVSAMSGETNRLVALAKSIADPPKAREFDVLLATGEQVTISLLSMTLEARGCPARSYTGSQVHILTDSAHTKARILEIDDKRIHDDLAQGTVVVVAGFQGTDVQGNITTLGRGGSDTTAVALAAALKADECQIYTDVDGVYTTDPRVVHQARRLDKICFEEMLEMASLGSKVLQIRAVEFASKEVGDTFNKKQFNNVGLLKVLSDPKKGFYFVDKINDPYFFNKYNNLSNKFISQENSYEDLHKFLNTNYLITQWE
ncbi:aspartate kinase, partial [Candidatus Marithioploca araucensis]|nr:aspartate kinase [Candidatus Marithioploca araucensis]